MNLGWMAIAAFLIGGIPTGVLISKRKYGIDVREIGSGNIGASNVRRVFGWYAGLLTFSIDFFKGAIPLWLAKQSLNSSGLEIIGIALVLGHCFSPFLGFRGGKGVATSLGCIAVVEPFCAALGFGVYVLVTALFRVSAFGSLAGILSCLLYLIVQREAVFYWRLILALCAIMLFRHIDNLKQVRAIKKAGRSSEKKG